MNRESVLAGPYEVLMEQARIRSRCPDGYDDCLKKFFFCCDENGIEERPEVYAVCFGSFYRCLRSLGLV